MNFFIFQEKRGDREVEQLFRSLELITEIKEGQVSFLVLIDFCRGVFR